MEQLDLYIQNWAYGLGWPMEGFFRLILAGVAGGLVGLERELRGRQAGFRTNLLVCLGSALVMIVSAHFAHRAWEPVEAVQLTIDPARIAYGVMTGVGFLGAGAIIKSGGSVRGLTTAAGLWCVAAVGLAAGFGLYVITILASLLILLALWLLDYVEGVLPRMRYRSITLRCKWESECIPRVIKLFNKAGLHVAEASFERIGDLSETNIYLVISFTNKNRYYEFERQVEQGSPYELIATREM